MPQGRDQNSLQRALFPGVLVLLSARPHLSVRRLGQDQKGEFPQPWRCISLLGLKCLTEARSPHSNGFILLYCYFQIRKVTHIHDETSTRPRSQGNPQ